MGRPLEEIKKEKLKQKRLIEEMELEVENTVAKLGPTGITEGSFFIAQFNYLCRNDMDSYPPCEAAVKEFSLEKGVILYSLG